MRQAFAGHALEQAVLPLRRRALARRRSGQPPPPAARTAGRNAGWRHLDNRDVISMPDKWEYPWFAAWDLAFHCVALAHVDPAFAKHQLLLLCREWYMHPNGQLPAYEWAFGDVNPPVHAWAALRGVPHRRRPRLRLPRARLPQAAAQLHLVGEPQGRRRRQRLRGRLPRARQHRPLRPLGAAARRRAARAVRRHRPGWRCSASTCSRWRCGSPTTTAPTRTSRSSSSSTSPRSPTAMSEAVGRGGRLLLRPPAHAGRLDRAAAGALDGRAAAALRRGASSSASLWERLPDFRARGALVHRRTSRSSPCFLRLLRAGRAARADLRSWTSRGCGACSARMLDEEEFLSPYGLRSLSRYHREHPLVVALAGRRGAPRLRAGRVDDRAVRRQLELARAGLVPGQLPRDRVAAAPARAASATSFTVECPTGSGVQANLGEVADDLERRLLSLFLLDERRAAAVLRRRSSASRATRPGATSSSSTSTSTATPATGSAPRTRPAGRRSPAR